MLEPHLRQAATVLLETTIRIAPPEARDWGRGLLGELTYVERPWSAVWWAMGGASVMARSALASFLIPGRGGKNVVADGGLFAKSFQLRKIILVVCGVFIFGALLFFLGPPYRHGVRTSLESWREVLLYRTANAAQSDLGQSTEPLGAQVFGREVAARNALVVHGATLAMLLFAAMVALALLALGREMFMRTRQIPPRPQPIAWAALLAGALGFLVSSATIYLTYRPYWYISQNQALNAGRSPADAARGFITVAQSLEYYGVSPAKIPLYFWIGVILLSVIGLVLILLRRFLGRPRANPAT